jgi:hypothetical protein
VNPTDRVLLEHCVNDYRTIVPLKGRIPSGTLYRHVARLVKLGWLDKQGALYRTTEAGNRQLAEAAGRHAPDVLAELYPPLALVPTPVHRAVVELILAAVVARQRDVREDRHPFFVVFGSTLRWKTSLGRFVCAALGLDPAVQVVDCSTEAGKSLTFRRGTDGTLTSKRTLLDTPFIVLDEFQLADRRVRSTLGIFLSGRLVMPVENEQLTVQSVPLLTLNPAVSSTLEGRVGLSTPLIRRALLVNLDAVRMPDLAVVGQQAIDAARARGPIVFGEHGHDLPGSHDTIVELVREVLIPEARERIDVEIVVNLCMGMTALIAETVAAIAQVVQDVATLAETLGWTRLGWREVVADFREGSKRSTAGTAALVRVATEAAPADSVKDASTRSAISLVAPSSPPPRRTSVPELDLSDALRARLIWFAMETQQDVEVALTILLDFYLSWRDSDHTIDTLAATLRLADRLDVTQVDVDTLSGYLRTRQQLGEAGCGYDDVPEALRVITLLQNLPFDFTWTQAETAMQMVAAILETGISSADATAFLERHRQLERLEFDGRMALAVADALSRVGAIGDEREAVLNHLVDLAGREVQIEALEARQQELETTVSALQAESVEAEGQLEQVRCDVGTIQQELVPLRKEKARLDEECQVHAGELAIAGAFEAFLMGKTAEADTLWTVLEGLLSWRRRGGGVDDAVGKLFADGVKREVVAVLQRFLRHAGAL